MGPTLAFRGLDNNSYYRLVSDDLAHYYDTTGTGNSLLMRSPHVLQLIMDSLRYWVTEMHVDGFRFDLAATLARQFHEVDKLSAFFDLIQQDPVVSQVKLIAEPWDVGEGGYQVGNFPPLWTEWNGKYRDTVRDFWRGERRRPRRVRLSLHRLQRPLRALRPQADRVDQLRHRPRRLHAARPRVLQREAQRGQRRGQQRRREPQPLVELRRRGPDRRPGDPRPAAAPAAQLPHHPAALAGRADDRCTATSSAAPRAATTTATARTTTSRGSSGILDEDDAEAARLHAVAGQAAPRAPGLPAPPVLRRQRRPRRRERARRHRLVHARRHSTWTRRPGATAWPSRSWSSSTARRSPSRTRAASRSSTTPSSSCSTPTTSRSTFTLPEEEYGAEWIPVIDTALHEVERQPARPDVADPGPAAQHRRAEVPARDVSPIVPGVTRGGHRVRYASAPVSTYRLQLEPDFTLDDAVAQVDHLAALGVTHLYLSPVLQATVGLEARLRRHRPHDGRRGARRRRRRSRGSSRPLTRPASASSSTSCPTT